MNVNSTSDASSTYTDAAYSNKGMSSMASGIDTESLVKSMLSGIQTKIDKQNQEKTQLEWKQTMYRDIITKVNTFQTKYCSLTSDSCLRSSTLFNAKVATSSSNAISVTAASTAAAGQHQIEVGRLATASSLRGAQVSSGAINLRTVTADRSVALKLGEQTVNVDLAGCSDAEAIRSALNTALTNAGRSESFTLDGDKLQYSGSSELTVSGSTVGLNMLGLQGGASATETDGSYTLTSGAVDPAATASTSLEFSLDGVTKQFTFAEGDDMAAMQEKVQRSFGSSIQFTDGGDGSFTVTAGMGQTVSVNGSASALSSVGLSQAASSRVDTKLQLGSLQLGAGALPAGDELTFSINDVAFTVSKTDTISDIMRKVNDSGAGVTMTYNSLEDRFSLTSQETGAGYQIDLEDTDGLLGAFGLTGGTMTEGQNALLKVDGTVIERSNNTFTYDGLTMTLNQTTGQYAIGGSAGNLTMTALDDAGPATVKTEANTAQVKEMLTSFVNDYNTLIEDLNKQIHEKATYKKYAPLTDAQKSDMTDKEQELWTEKAKTGLLHNDNDISTFLQDMRAVLYGKYGENVLANFGIDTSSNYKDYGKLKIDDSKLDTALATDLHAVQDLFTGENGLAAKLNDACAKTANTSSGTPGTLVQLAGVKGKATEKNNTISTRLNRISDRITSLKSMYEMRKTRYWAQFNSMETALTSFGTTSSYLTSMLNG